MISTPVSDLKKEIDGDRVLIIAGTGVSASANNVHPCTSWKGLLEHGVGYCVNHNLIDGGEESQIRANITFGTQPGRSTSYLIAAAQHIADALQKTPKHIHYGKWLEECFESLKATDRTLLEALRDMEQIIATTNYDGLIEEVTGWKTATWQDSSVIEEVLRGSKKSKHVLHLHGYYEKPEMRFSDFGHTQIFSTMNTCKPCLRHLHIPRRCFLLVAEKD